MRRTSLALATLAVASLALAACGSGTSDSGGADGDKTVTVYSADGLGDWYSKQFVEFEKQTGITVQMIEAGSGEVVSRLQKEKANVQADLVVTLPPYIQKADADGLLQPYTPAGADQVTGATDTYVQLPLLHLQPGQGRHRSDDVRRSAQPHVRQEASVLDARPGR